MINQVINVANNAKYMFFDDAVGVYRIDKLVHPFFDRLTRKMKGFFWTPEEFDVTKDIKDFKVLDDTQRNIFLKVLGYQNFLDSAQSISPSLTMLPHTSLPELMSHILWWSAMEQTHADSYSYLIRNVVPDSTSIFDETFMDSNILARAENTTKYYDDFLEASVQYRANNSYISLFELKRKFLMMMVSVNVLEGVNFYASFAASFAFAELGFMTGNAKIITSISRDESIHLAGTQYILKAWREGKDDPDFKILFNQEIDQIKALYENIVEREREWCSYLFNEGSLLGLNEKILGEYVEYITGNRLRALGIKHNYTTKNPLPWMNKYLGSADKQDSPQEENKVNYIIGGIKNDIGIADFQRFKVR